MNSRLPVTKKWNPPEAPMKKTAHKSSTEIQRLEPHEYPAETCVESEIFFSRKTLSLNMQGHTSGSEAGKAE